MPPISMDELMATSGVQFGTSGARGPVARMNDRLCYLYTCAFLQFLRRRDQLKPGAAVAIAGDRRASTPRILAACAAAIADFGAVPRHLGYIPSPALAAFGLAHDMPSLMVTGSHIPDDRNGIKFNTRHGEILKQDECAIRSEQLSVDERRFDAKGAFLRPPQLPQADSSALDEYVARYTGFLPPGCLTGMRIGLYLHSTVAGEAFARVLGGLGAEVISLAPSTAFIPVDTEAIRVEDVALARRWAAEERFDAIVSADGDGDRPLVADEAGEWLRGDVAGVLCARYLGIEAVATPVSSNTVVERCNSFRRVARTRIGSPFVIEAMQALGAEGFATIAGYEANGGFLLGSPVERAGRRLDALPTRDALIVAATLLAASAAGRSTLSALLHGLPSRHTASDRLREFPVEEAAAVLTALRESGRQELNALLAPHFGPVRAVDLTDGLRLLLDADEVVHFRPSGNAPELRCYVEAATRERAAEMLRHGMALLARWRAEPPTRGGGRSSRRIG